MKKKVQSFAHVFAFKISFVFVSYFFLQFHQRKLCRLCLSISNVDTGIIFLKNIPLRDFVEISGRLALQIRMQT